MLPIEKAKGHIWRDNQYLCETDYEVTAPFVEQGLARVQRVVFLVAEHHKISLDSYTLVLVLADSRRFAIPRPIQGYGVIECYIEDAQKLAPM